MDVLKNVLEETRQFFMGVPKQVQGEDSGQAVWPTGAPPPEEGTPALSGAPAPSSRPPSAAAAPAIAATPVPMPPRPPSEPLEPKPHIIHKATVMREAAEKRREIPDIEDEEEPLDNLSPPSHIIHKPPPTLSSPAAAPAAPCPSPARPPSAAPSLPLSSQEPQLEPSGSYRVPVNRVHTPTSRPPEHFAPSRPPDPYSASRPPEPYRRYYEQKLVDSGRTSHGPIASPQPSMPSRQSYARISTTMPQHMVSRLRDAPASHSPPAQRYAMPVTQPPPPHNDRVPPIHHPQTPPAPKLGTMDARTAQIYPTLQQRRESSPYARTVSHYDRHPTVSSRKYDPQQAFPGYRPTPAAPQPLQNHRVDTHHQVPYKHIASEALSAHYPARPLDRSPVPPVPHTHDASRLPTRSDYVNVSRNIDARANYPYPVSPASTSKYTASAPVPVPKNSTLPTRPGHRAPTTPRINYDYTTPNPVQTSPARSITKPGYPGQPARPTVSVTSIVNEMNQTKQKRESPLDLSVKTVKNSADSSTTQDDVIDSATSEHKNVQAHPSSSGRNAHIPDVGYVGSHKVDFSPNFSQYGDRNVSHSYNAPAQPIHPPLRFNGSYEAGRPVPERYPVESPHQSHTDKYPVPVVGRTEYVSRHIGDNRHLENRIRDDRTFIIEERKRPAGPIVSNIPEKIVRYETWVADSRIQRMTREQDELMRQPLYNYNSHKQFEAYHNEYKRATIPGPYRDHPSLSSHRYPSNHYPAELPSREPIPYHTQYLERNSSIINSRNHHVIKRFPNHRDGHPHHLDPNGVLPVDNSVKSILRSNLETKQSGFVEPPRISKQIPDLIVIDDIDDSVIEIPDDSETNIKSVAKAGHNTITQNLSSHIQMPKAVDSLPRDSEYHTFDNTDTKSKSPENDVASRIRTKAELKVMPPSQDSSLKAENKQDNIAPESDRVKIVPKSQKQHLFNQIREDNLRLESVIKSEKPSEITVPEVKSEPMNIDEIERDAEISIKTENILQNLDPEGIIVSEDLPADDLDWASACDSFMEQLKSGCHKKRAHKKRIDTLDNNNENKSDESQRPEIIENAVEKSSTEIQPTIVIKQEPVDSEEITTQNEVLEPELDESSIPVIENEHQSQNISQNEPTHSKETRNAQKSDKSNKGENKNDKNKGDKKAEKENDKTSKAKLKMKGKTDKDQATSSNPTKRESKEKQNIKTIIKEESESTDDDEPLIKSKILKEKEQSERLKYQLLKDLSEKSAYVKLECCDVDVNKNSRKSLDSSLNKEKEDKSNKSKVLKQNAKPKVKKLSVDYIKTEKQAVDSSSDSDDESLSVASRLRTRKSIKTEEKDNNNKTTLIQKTPIKSSPCKKVDSSSSSSSTSNSSTPVRKPDFGDGSAFHPGWEEELYKYKRSLRMPTRLIAIPRGRSGGPFVRRTGTLLTRGSTSLPDLDPAPLSPAPSSAPSAATDDLCARRQEKLTLDSDLDSNSSCSARHRLHYDSEASTSTVFSSRTKRKGSSIVDVLIQKCVPKDNPKKKSKDKDDKTPKVIPKKSNTSELLPTPSLGLVKNGNKGSLSAKKEKLMEDIYYLGAFRKETVTAFRNAFIKNTDGLIGATEEFQPVVLKSRTRTESRVLKQRATIKEVFGDERPASAPPTSCREEELQEEKEPVEIKKEPEPKPKLKPKKIVKDKMKRRSSSIRDGLRSTKSLKRNDAKGRLLRLKKRNSLMKSFKNKRIKDNSANKHKTENPPSSENNENIKAKEESSSLTNTEGNTKRRLKRLFGRRKFSSGFDYIRKKKKIIRREENSNNKIRRPAVKPSPESIHDIHKEIKSWFINKSVGETHLHRAARLGYTDCVAYCLEKMESDPSAKDNAGFTPLHVAAAKGHVRIARLLLQYGANVSAAAQGGIRPLHEACENCHVEVIRLLLAYGADPLLGTYAGQTPEELTEGSATVFLRLHIADVQGLAVEPWRFPPPTDIIDREELGCDPLASPPPGSPPPPPDSTIEIQSTEAPLPPFYSLRTAPGQPADGLWCLLQDITNLLQIKSKDSLLKQIHCGSGSPRELLREIRTQEFLERAQCHQLLCAGEKVNVRASKVALVRVTDKLRQLLKIETVLVS
ncbi:hypothetical protein O3G_MSEX009799 [Manduca sexta]|uniref:BCL-6 corepressor n=1 Tax=Manduca sexta TaxID=7130 RepID=A0A922CSB4_MANSE|nr:hypothetical protein O3G_MSEX009799 [Manduca sexta]